MAAHVFFLVITCLVSAQRSQGQGKGVTPADPYLTGEGDHTSDGTWSTVRPTAVQERMQSFLGNRGPQGAPRRC